MRPISNTVEILVTGLEAASFSFLASNLGLKSSTGSRCANAGTSLGLSFSSFVFSSSLFSGNLGSSCSTTMCFLRRDHPLTFDFKPFDFCKTLRGSAALSFFSGATADSFSLSCVVSLPRSDSKAGDCLLGTAAVGAAIEPSVLIGLTALTGSFDCDTSVGALVSAFCSVFWVLSLPKNFLTALKGSRSPDLGGGCLISGGFVLVSF
uniref:Uncharacterized protein n=1 Tax=Cynoglossus semilaevis TaxID=244447 RepID=A0A3P8ULT2_CYNSE